MGMVEKFLFDDRFDAPAPSPAPVVEPEEGTVADEPPPPPPPPTFSEAELDAARRQAYEEGVAEGVARARQEAAEDQGQRMNLLLAELSGKVAALLTEEAARVAQSREMTMQIALGIARKLLPHYTARHGLAEVEAAVLHVLGGLGDEPRLVVRVAEEQLEAVTLKVQDEAVRYGFGGKLIFLGEPSMGPASCRVEWADGGLERDTMRLWGEVERLAAEVLRGNYAPDLKGQTGSGTGKDMDRESTP